MLYFITFIGRVHGTTQGNAFITQAGTRGAENINFILFVVTPAVSEKNMQRRRNYLHSSDVGNVAVPSF